MVNVHALVAVGVNADGHREILGLDVSSGEDKAGWMTFFRGLVARGLTGVTLVTSDARPVWSPRSEQPCPVRHGSGAAPTTQSTGGTALHEVLGGISITPKSSWPGGPTRFRGRVETLLHSVYDQPDADSVHSPYDRVLDALSEKLPKVAAHLDDARAELLALTAFPKEIWRQIWSDNP